MDIFNGTEFELDIGVINFVFVAFACCSVGNGVDLRDAEKQGVNVARRVGLRLGQDVS